MEKEKKQYEEKRMEEKGTIYWNDVDILHSSITNRQTEFEMVSRPGWGISCFMDNNIQSCELDEYLYHEALVHPVMTAAENRKRVLIIGGGEGATAREVLKWKDVEEVHMYEWDKEVVDHFKDHYPQWSKGAWNDSRLHIFYDDIFEKIQERPDTLFDVIIVDLFDPSNDNILPWYLLLKNLHYWIHTEGSIVLYSGMRNILEKEQMYTQLMNIINDSMLCKDNSLHILPIHKRLTPYRVFIPSFMGESTFVLIQSSFSSKEPEFSNLPDEIHLNDAIWNSYKTMNW